MPRSLHRLLAGALLAIGTVAAGSAASGLAACGPAPEPAPVTIPPPVTPSVTPSVTNSTPAIPWRPVQPPPPAWVVGAHPLPLRPDGFGEVLPTPPELVDRRLPTLDRLPPPVSGDYESSVSEVPADVLARSTWKPGCPVPPRELRYLTMSFHGFDGRPHTGEMIVHADVAQDIVLVFGQLFAQHFPIEEMRVVALPELGLPPTGDSNNTTAFVCRPAVGEDRLSAHAYGVAIDVNPFQNPYQDGDLVLPELASAYLDRDQKRPGMVELNLVVLHEFEILGWKYGGLWDSPVDTMHFTLTN